MAGESRARSALARSIEAVVLAAESEAARLWAAAHAAGLHVLPDDVDAEAR